ncbi:hypothetical protein SO694_00059060 [Aureococcus anophagefferens]|uniref:VCBS repeat-containing protein n=1 Tax=Aureococcus anophagefferens TaxID=44056 RepID=A0ABR1FYR8_AURAN
MYRTIAHIVLLVATLPLATSDCRRTSPVPRVDAATLSGTRLLEEFVLRDVPVVLSSAVDVARLAGLEGWDAPPAWVDALLGELAVAADGAASLRNESAGCEGGCAWPPSAVDAQRRPARTDAACVPSWSLQVTGLTRWTFERRSPAEADGAAAPAPNLLAACPDIRAHEGFDGFRARGRRRGPGLRPRGLRGRRRRDVAIVPTSRLGDGDLDLVVGDATGAVTYFENVGGASAPAFAEARVSPALADLDGDGDLDLLLTSELRRPLGVRNEGTLDAPAFAVDGLGYARDVRLDVPPRRRLRFKRFAKVAAGRASRARRRWWWRPRRASPSRGSSTTASCSSSRRSTRRSSRTSTRPPVSRSFPLDAGGRAPALGDLTGDGVDDLLLGGHHGTVFFFDGAARVARAGGPATTRARVADNFYFQTARVGVE